MESKELLEKYPKVKDVIKEWWKKTLYESMEKNNIKDEALEDFKKQIELGGIDDGKVSTIMDVNPAALFRLFDENQVFIEIQVDSEILLAPLFGYRINGNPEYSGSAPLPYKHREDAESQAVVKAFEILNNKL